MKKIHNKTRTTKKKQIDYGSIDSLLLGIVMILILIGLIMIASAGIAYGEARFDDPYHFLKRQMIYVVIGLGALFITQKIDYHFFRKWSFVIFMGAIVLLILVLIPGIGGDVYGASRWIKIGPLSFQPSEAVKLALILYFAAWFASRGTKTVRKFSEGVVWFVGVLLLVGGLIMLQPDMGTMMMITVIALAIFFLAGARMRHITAIIASGIVLLFILIKSAPYRAERLMTFLNPSLDPQGAGYQINQALLAIGSGGVFGLGLGFSRQKHLYLPEPVGDSIYAVIGEEIGLFGGLIIIFLFMGFLLRGLKIANNAPDVFGRLVAGGIVVWIVFQSLFNIAAITGLVPLTGIPLPFISYGGTSIVFMLMAIGILLNISKQSDLK